MLWVAEKVVWIVSVIHSTTPVCIELDVMWNLTEEYSELFLAFLGVDVMWNLSES